MDSAKEAKPLRPFQAIIWGPQQDSVGVRAVYYACDADDAKKQAIEEHGERCIISIWNEEDANEPRFEQNAEQVMAHQPAKAPHSQS